MTTYSLMDGVSGRPGNGPALVTSASGGWLIGTQFSVTGQMMWLDSYRLWVPTNGDVTARKFALWNTTGSSTETLVPGSVVTSGVLTLGAWNVVNLARPIQLAPGTQYVAACGWTVVTGISVTSNQFDSGQPFAAGIVNGPLTGWSAGTGSNPYPVTGVGVGIGGQQVFSNALGADPSVAMPNNGSGSDNLWIDVVVDDTAPGGYSGSYRLWPNRYELGNWNLDTANNFTLGQAFSLSSACTINNVWFYSPASVTQLPTEVAVMDTSGTVIASNSSPSWVLLGGGAAAAGQGWMSASLSGSLSPSTTYWACVLNGAGSPAIWNAAAASYWTTGFGGGGLVAGPITAPNNAGAPSPGQNSYHQAATLHLPDTNAGPFHYGVDIEVTPASGGPVSASFGLAMAPLKESFTAAERMAATFALGMAPLKESFTAHETGSNITSTFALGMAPLKLRFSQRSPGGLAIPSDEESRAFKRWLLWEV